MAMRENGFLDTKNADPRFPVALLLDASLSMGGTPIDMLNAGVQDFIRAVKGHEILAYSMEIAIITFGEGVRVLSGFKDISQISVPTIVADGKYTYLGQAVNKAIDLIDDRVKEYDAKIGQKYDPWIVILSDGGANDPGWENAAQRLQSLLGHGQQRGITSFCIGIGDEYANKTTMRECLQAFSPPHRKPIQLDGLKFKEFFSWLKDMGERMTVSMPGAGIKLDGLLDFAARNTVSDPLGAGWRYV